MFNWFPKKVLGNDGLGTHYEALKMDTEVLKSEIIKKEVKEKVGLLMILEGK